MNNNDNGPFIVVLVGALFGAYLVWKFGVDFGLNFHTSWSVLKGLGAAIGIWVAIYYVGVRYLELIGFWDTVPVGLVLVWYAWWPALNYWSAQRVPHELIMIGAAHHAWYDQMYIKWGIVAAILVVGYGLRWQYHSNYPY